MALKYVLLGFLNKKKHTGYDMSRKIDKSAGFFWSASQSQIYPTLKKLKNEGFVETEQVWEENTAPKIFYSLTDKGKEDLINYLNKLPKIADMKTDLGIHLFFSQGFVSDEGLIGKLQNEQRYHQQRLEEYREYEKTYLEREIHKSNIGRYITLQYGISYEKGMIDFCEWAIEFIKNREANLQIIKE